MSIAYRVQDYIAAHDLPWDPVAHRTSNSCMEAARFAHIPPDRLAKAVVLEDRDGYIVAVVPANHRVDLSDLAEKLHRKLSLANERELQGLFSDCAPGAVPPVGQRDDDRGVRLRVENRALTSTIAGSCLGNIL